MTINRTQFIVGLVGTCSGVTDFAGAAAAPTGSVKGRLLLADGKQPARGYLVAVQTATWPDAATPREQWREVYAKGAMNYVETVVAENGTFKLEGLSVGKFALDVRRPGEREAWSSLEAIEIKPGAVTELGEAKVAATSWRRLFNGNTLEGWKRSDFIQSGNVRVSDGAMIMEVGNAMTGLTLADDKELPRVEYEVTLQAQRMSGRDFFCGLTFPVKKDPCTLILGGWGGATVGLSNIDFSDASMNDTTQSIDFEQNRWYRVRLRVTATHILVWLDEERIINQELDGRRIGIRIETEPCVPFGFCTWRTVGAIRDLRIRKL